MELFSPISSIIETVDLISTILDDTLGSLPLSLAHNKQLYGYIYIYIYISASISTEVSWSVSQLVGRRYIIYLTSYSLTIASTFGFISLIKINTPFSSIWFMLTYLASNWFVSIMIISSKRGSLLLLSMNCIVALLNQTSSLLDQYQLTTLCDNKMMIHSLFKFWL